MSTQTLFAEGDTVTWAKHGEDFIEVMKETYGEGPFIVLRIQENPGFSEKVYVGKKNKQGEIEPIDTIFSYNWFVKVLS